MKTKQPNRIPAIVLALVGLLVLAGVAMLAFSHAASDKLGGITGITSIAQNCPQLRLDDAACASKHQSVAFQIVSATTGEVVREVESDSNGSYKINLEPGTYTVRSHAETTYPQTTPQTVIVTAGSYQDVNLDFSAVNP